MTWYAAYSDHRGVTRAVAGLTERGFKTYVPRETRWRRSARRKDRVQVPLLGRYLFVAIPEDRSLYEVATTLGVAGFVGIEGVAYPISRAEVAALQTQEAQGLFDRTQSLKPTFRPGQAVKITRGPFTGYPAQVIAAASAENRVRIMLTFFGRASPMTLEVGALKAA